MAIKAILFDKDGTLIETNGTWVPIYRLLLAQEFGAGPSEVERLLMQCGYDPETESFMAGSILAGGTTRQLVSVWWPNETALEQDQRARHLNLKYAPTVRQMLKPLLPLVPVFDALKAMGLLLGVATNDSEGSALGHMQEIGVDQYFAAIIGADSVAVPKPSGEMIALFCQKTGLHPQEIAMVGDNSHDLEEAHHGGAGLAIAVLSGNGGRDDLEPLADHVIDSVADIPALLRML